MAYTGIRTAGTLAGGLKRNLLLCQQHVKARHIAPYRHHSFESDGKTSVHILNRDTEVGLMIDSYSQVGFRLNNGMVVLGPMVLFPRSVLSWNVSGTEDINAQTLSLFCHLEPKIDILVLGVGDTTANAKWNREIIAFMSRNRINVEALPTEQACATFNFLNAENRYVAAAMIPPNELRITEDDIFQTKLRRKQLYESEGF